MVTRMIAVMLGLVVFLAVSCAEKTPQIHPATSIAGNGGPADVVVNWDAPLPNGTTTATDPTQNDIARAEQDVPFTVVTPTALGQPSGLVEQDPSTGIKTGVQGIAFVYHSSPYGAVDIIEATPSMPAGDFMKQLHAMVDQWTSDPSLLHGSFKFVNLSDGSEALATTSEDGSRVTIVWLTPGGVEVTVEGPALSFDDSITVANSLVGSATPTPTAAA